MDNITYKNFYTENIFRYHFKLPPCAAQWLREASFYVITGARRYTGRRKKARARDVVILVTAHAYIINTRVIYAHTGGHGCLWSLRP